MNNTLLVRWGLGFALGITALHAQALKPSGTSLQESEVPGWVLSATPACSAVLITPRVALTCGRPFQFRLLDGVFQRQTGRSWPMTPMGTHAVTQAGAPEVLGEIGLIRFQDRLSALYGGPGNVPRARIPSYQKEKTLLTAGAATPLVVYGTDRAAGTGLLSLDARRTTQFHGSSQPSTPIVYRTWREVLADEPSATFGSGLTDQDVDDMVLVVAPTVADRARGLSSPIVPGPGSPDMGSGIFAQDASGEEWLVASVTSKATHLRLSHQMPWIYDRLMSEGLIADAVGLAKTVLGTGAWGDNDRRATVGDIYVRENPNGYDVEFFRLAAVGPDGRYGAFPTDRRDDLNWEYLGTRLPDREQATVPVKTWGTTDRHGVVGDLYIYANPYTRTVEYFRLKSLGSDGRYWYFPTDGKDNAWWTSLGTDLPTRRLKFAD
ncbi:MAG: hypothetical protein EOP37_17100 [Rubrivivax sp.]|nr:MAG: hypothetical protein EOP37_17100 [Rubrivivax sp.]